MGEGLPLAAGKLIGGKMYAEKGGGGMGLQGKFGECGCGHEQQQGGEDVDAYVGEAYVGKGPGFFLLPEPSESECADGIGGEDEDQVFYELRILRVAHPVHDLWAGPTGDEDGGETREDEGKCGRGKDFSGVVGLFGEVKEGGF